MPPSKQQQGPKRKRRGKELLLSALEDGGATSKDEVDAVIAELERESERRVKKMRRAMDDMKQRFLNAFQVELLKIPRRVRCMKLGTFLEEFGGSVDEALKRAVLSESTMAAPAARPAAVAQTPRHAPPAANPGMSRLPRNGEVIMSVNGSPLMAVPLSATGKLAATVKMKHNPRSRLPANIAKDAQLLVETGEGVVNLNQPETLRALADAPDAKSAMLSQLHALQVDIANVMKSLQ